MTYTLGDTITSYLHRSVQTLTTKPVQLILYSKKGVLTLNNNNNILFYGANIQFNKNLFSALYKKKCVQQEC